MANMLQYRLIQYSYNPFASPVLLVKKRDDSWRFCVDYKHLNELTVKDRYLIPNIDELHVVQVFNKIDLKSGYHQIKVKPKDVHKTTFQTHHGHYEFLVMTFGFTNAPATFQNLMNQVRKFVLVLFDDILVYSINLKTHLNYLSGFFKMLKDNQLYANKSKCSFAQKTIEYLEHVISASRVSMDHSKTECIMTWPEPKNIKTLSRFMQHGTTGDL